MDAIRPYKVVVVDDCVTMRRWLTGVIAQDDRLEVVGLAGSAEEARKVIKATNPDVLTLDIEMPGIDGLEFLSHLMRLRPMPVVMLASAIRIDSPHARRAMQIGAVACVPKPGSPDTTSIKGLRDIIFNAAAGLESGRQGIAPAVSAFCDRILLVGASTGGVAAVETLLATLPRDIPPIVIAQHMPHGFLGSFVDRLDRMCDHTVRFADDGLRLHPGTVYICPSRGMQTRVTWHDDAWHSELFARRRDHMFCPSVDALFSSGVPWADRTAAAILTGLGSDGAEGMLALRTHGARTIGQSRDSCAVYGMPGAARALNATEEEAAVEDIAARLFDRMLWPHDRLVAP